MGRIRDLANQQFGRLTVLRPVGVSNSRGKNVIWLCICSCGKNTKVESTHLNGGNTKSCGCLQIKHGLSKTSEYHTLRGMIDRCSNPKCKAYKYYGGRGIQVCDRWKNPVDGLQNFISDMGKKPLPDLSIDRIDNDGNYEPGNCRWATQEEQQKNKRRPTRKVPARVILIHKEQNVATVNYQVSPSGL